MKFGYFILGVLEVLKTADICAYIAYISKVMLTYLLTNCLLIFPFKRFMDEHAIKMYKFTHHSIHLIKFISLHEFSSLIN